MNWFRAHHGTTVARLISFRLAMAATLVLLLQIVPIFALVGLFPAHIMLTMLVSPLVQLALLALIVESFMGRVPPILVLLPVALYGVYYSAVLNERYVLVPRIENELGAQNTGVVTFDPATETLHDDSGLDARKMVIAYDLPRIFDTVITQPSVVEPASPEQCRQSDELGSRNPQWRRVAHQQRLFCVKREYEPLPPVPMLTISMPMTVVTSDVVPRYDDTYTFKRNGEAVGAFTQSNLDLLSLFPQFTVGCGLLEFPTGWRCGLKFDRTIFSTDGIDALPRRDGSASKLTVDTVRIAAMLGLQPRGDAELKSMALSR